MRRRTDRTATVIYRFIYKYLQVPQTDLQINLRANNNALNQFGQQRQTHSRHCPLHRRAASFGTRRRRALCQWFLEWV